MDRKFAVFILTHGRANNVITYKTLRASGYTGEIYLIVDDLDKTVDQYRKNFGDDKVIVFDKKAMADKVDEGNNFDDLNVVVHARNANFEIAERLGLTHFAQLDDDYGLFLYRNNEGGKTIRKIDQAFSATLDFLDESGAKSVAWSQGGDHIGGFAGVRMKRKVMNAFFCRVDRPFMFVGNINEDVNTYVIEGTRGHLFFTFYGLQLNQAITQSQAGGLTDIYLHRGTYFKSFTTILFAPSCVRIAIMNTKHIRIHHLVDWRATCPKIIPEIFRRGIIV